MWGIDARDISQVPRTLIAIVVSHTSGVVSHVVPANSTPALLNRTSMRPWSRITSATTRAQSSSDDTSARIAPIAWPSRAASSTTASSASCPRPVTTTWAPSRAKRNADSRPRPLLPPVISATLSLSRTTTPLVMTR